MPARLKNPGTWSVNTTIHVVEGVSCATYPVKICINLAKNIFPIIFQTERLQAITHFYPSSLGDRN